MLFIKDGFHISVAYVCVYCDLKVKRNYFFSSFCNYSTRFYYFFQKELFI